MSAYTWRERWMLWRMFRLLFVCECLLSFTLWLRDRVDKFSDWSMARSTWMRNRAEALHLEEMRSRAKRENWPWQP